MSEKIKKILFSLSFIVIIFILSVSADRIIGLFINENIKSAKSYKGIIFKPNVIVRHTTTEFDYVVKINSLGIRDKEISIKKQVDKKRILSFGDSFTYGWGVDIEQSWPKVLEKFLLENGYEIEVINCGQPGVCTSAYKKSMEKAVPLLKPDIVLIGVLQLGDLAQLYQELFRVKRKSNKSNILKNLIKAIKVSYKNTIYFYKKIIKQKKIIVENKWLVSSQNIISSFSRFEYLRYCTLDDSIKAMFESGNLNPALINFQMDFPDGCIIFNNPKHPATKFAIEKMEEDIRYMKEICEANQCQLIFINIPMSNFVGHNVIRNSNLDSIFGEYLYNNNNIDSVYSNIANQFNIPYFEMTDIFKKLSKTNDHCFFRYDGHPNSKGHYVLGKSIGEFLIGNKIIEH
ncbi:MAG: SGNH/GDSL hydrolase family protein [Candidatus Omnitrophica bacterium]|nr:SGNH/GDSL hydrolase family protein [Candidatus Omnitrophota bacterium]